MRVIIIEDTVYKVTEKQYEEILKAENNFSDYRDPDYIMYTFLHSNKKDYTLIGVVDFDFRL